MQGRSPFRLLEPFVLLVLAGVLLLLSRGTGTSPVIPHPSAAATPNVARTLLFIHGMVLLLAAAGSYGLIRQGRPGMAARVSMQWRVERHAWTEMFGSIRAPAGVDAYCLVALSAIGILLRLNFIEQPLRLDEAHSLLTFVEGRFADAFFYPLPNNHVLYSLAAKFSVVLLGDGPLGIRMPALLAGIALIPLSYRLSKALSEHSSGLLAAAGSAVQPMMVLYSTNGRGYSLLVLLSVGVTLLFLEEADARTAGNRWLFPALLTASGMLVMPSMLYFTVGIAGWYGLAARSPGTGRLSAIAGFLLPYGLATAWLTLLFYTPVAYYSGGFGALESSSYMQPVPSQLFSEVLRRHLAGTLRIWSMDVPDAVDLAALALMGVAMIAWKRNRSSSLLIVLVVAALAVVVFTLRIPFPRTWIFLLPFAWAMADAGFGELVRLSPFPCASRVAGVVVVLGSLLFAGSIAARDTVSGYADTGRVPDGPAIGSFLAQQGSSSDRVCAEPDIVDVVDYYLRQASQPQAGPGPATGGRVFLIRQRKQPSEDQLRNAGAGVIRGFSAATVYDATGVAPDDGIVADTECASVASIVHRRQD